MKKDETRKENQSLAVITLDDASRIKYLYGDTEADHILKGIVYLLNENKEEDTMLFRLDGFFDRLLYA